MESQTFHVRHCVLYCFKRGLNASAAAREICGTYGDNAISVSTCKRWYAKFRAGDLSLMDEPREGRPQTVDDDLLQSLLHANPRQSTRELAKCLGCSHVAIQQHLHSLGKVLKYGYWLPHELSISNKTQRISICASLLSRYNNASFLENIITGDEKWVMYANVSRKRQWIGPNDEPQPDVMPELHPKKVMLCVWWDMNGIIYYDLMNNKLNINASVYSHQLQCVTDACREKRPALVNRKASSSSMIMPGYMFLR